MRLLIYTCLLVATTLGDSSPANSTVNSTESSLCNICDCLMIYNSSLYNNESVKVSCSGRHLSEISDATELPKNIEVLDLSNNDLRYAGINPEGAKVYLRTLLLKTNNIARLAEPDFYHVFGLEHLDLSDNSLIEIIGRAFIYLKKLKTLDLSRNILRELPDDVFSPLQDLLELNLAGNPLHSIGPNVVSKLPSLRHLDLSQSALSNLHRDAFKGCDNLQDLNLARNNFESVPTRAFQNVDHLEKLILTGNPITILDQRSFWFPTELAEVELDQMPQLSEVRDKTFSRQTSLKRIDLSRNVKLFYLDAQAFQGVGSLDRLDLSHNRLATVVNGEELSSLCSDSYMDLSDNPWTCDCNLHWILPCISSSNTSVGTCAQPETKEGYQINQLAKEDLTCEEDTWLLGTVRLNKRLGVSLLCLGLIGIITCSAAIYVLIRYKPRITWNRRTKDKNEHLYYVRMSDCDPEKLRPRRY